MSSEELPESELAEIEAKAAAATPGPWQSVIDRRDHDGGENFIMTGSDDRDIYLRGATDADQDFIAMTRAAVPRLVAEIRRLRAMLRGTAKR